MANRAAFGPPSRSLLLACPQKLQGAAAARRAAGSELFATEGPAPKPTSLWEIGLRGGGLAVAGFEPTQGP